MRQGKWERSGIYVLILLFNIAGVGCSQMAADSELKADITTKAKEEIYFAGVTYCVAGRIVTLTGNCPTQEAKTRAEAIVSGIAGVKTVVNNIKIAPVVITADLLLKRAADSVLKNYAQAQADVADSAIIVSGNIKDNEHENLVAALQQLHPKKLADELVIQ